MRYYRLTLVSCVLAWFLIGLHFPAVHQMTHHGRPLPLAVGLVLALLGVVAVTGLWLLLRARAPGGGRAEPGTSA